MAEVFSQGPSVAASYQFLFLFFSQIEAIVAVPLTALLLVLWNPCNGNFESELRVTT
jgi:hypothetical protein